VVNRLKKESIRALTHAPRPQVCTGVPRLCTCWSVFIHRAMDFTSLETSISAGEGQLWRQAGVIPMTLLRVSTIVGDNRAQDETELELESAKLAIRVSRTKINMMCCLWTAFWVSQCGLALSRLHSRIQMARLTVSKQCQLWTLICLSHDIIAASTANCLNPTYGAWTVTGQL